MSCLLSASITLILVDLFLVYVINKLDKHLFVNITPSMPYLRISLAFAFCFFAAGTCVKTFVKYHINYIHIFEIDYHYRLPAIDLFQTASMFLSIFSLVFTLTLMNFIRMKLDLDQNDSQKVYAFEEGNLIGLLFLLIFCIFWLNPIDCFQKHQRFSGLHILSQIVISPFGSVKFCDFFLADVLTSATVSFHDFGYIFEGIIHWKW